MKFKTQYNRKEYTNNYETIQGPALTVPDQTMSIRTILERYSRGIPYNERTPIYEGENPEFVDISRLDFADRETLAKEYKIELDELKEKQKNIKRKSGEKVKGEGEITS